MLRRDDLIGELEDHRDRIQRAIEILKSGARRPRRKNGRRRKRRLSAAARKRISESQKRRWAAAKQEKQGEK
jgi:hypothetical protein